jgi:hypothetical protein
MKQQEVFKKIGGIIKELSDQYEYLQTTTGELNDLELELFVSNAHFLADHIEVLRKLNLQNNKIQIPHIEKPEKPREQKFFEPVVQQMKHGADSGEPKTIESEIAIPKEDQPVPEIDLTADSAADTYTFITEEPETIRHELILDEAINWEDDEDLPIENEPLNELKSEETEITAAHFEPEVVAETEDKNLGPGKEKTKSTKHTGDEDVLTINQKMSSQLADKANLNTGQSTITPINDIKLAITLNDKLLYVKDLFNGYNLAYSEAIEILNRFNTFDEATRFLKTNYVTKNNWDSKPVTTEKFYELLKRRYV